MPFAAVPTAALSASLPTSLPEAIRFRSCVDDKQTDTLCDRVYDLTGVDWLAESADWILAKPTAIATIVVVAAVIRFLLHRLIRRLAHRAAEGTVPGVLAKGKGHKILESSPLLSERRKQRADTMSSANASLVKRIPSGCSFTSHRIFSPTVSLPSSRIATLPGWPPLFWRSR